MKDIIKIRPHHGMCLAYFRGNGYSEGFVRHMQEMKEKLENDPQIELVVKTDEICFACPNNEKGSCQSGSKAEAYDRAVLKACRLQEGQQLSYLTFARLVQEEILDKGGRPEICGDCKWDALCYHQNR